MISRDVRIVTKDQIALVATTSSPMLNTEGTHRVRDFMASNPQSFSGLEEVAEAISRYNPHRPQPRI